ncbi:hypothetical protein M758_1G020000 [Ceratodon purpureus]|nr:hypothetical protein M758_1G020000 [Ceratodon purpureus]KAG0628349.1 hypothetical protein M758_1G020000 [Ceratodon purpureus]
MVSRFQGVHLDYGSAHICVSKHAALWSGLAVRNSCSAKDDMKVDSPILGGGGLGAYMADPLFSEDDSSIVTSTHFSLCDPEESGLSLFGGGDSGDVKGDYNWDNCFGSLEDVDNLLSSDPDSAFGRATSSPATLQWDDSSSALDLQSESEISGTKSSSIINAGPVENGKVDFFDSKLEFVPVNTPLPVLCEESDHNATFQEAEFQAPTSFDSRSHNSQLQAKQQSELQSGGQVNSSDFLDDEKMMEVLTGSLPTSESADNPSGGKDVTEDDSGPSTVSVSDSEKVKMAQAHRARRHAVNRKRFEERTKRQLNHRKIFQAASYGGPQAPQVLHPMPPMHMPAQAAHLHQPSIPNMHGYPVNPPALLPLQPMIRPVPPYVHVGFSTPLHVIPQVAPPSVPGQMQGPAMYVGYQQPCAFPQPTPPYQQHQLRPPGEVQVLPQPSTPTMTPQEKIEKLKFLQQMQARFAVEQQQQQFAAQGIAPLDTSGLRKGVTPVPQNLSVKELDADVKPSETKMAAADSDFEPSLSVGQTSVGVTSDDEGGSLEASVLEQLQNTIKTQLELGTRMCIRDALYRLARSAMRRQASSGRPTGGDGANCSQVSQDADATSSGLEASINSDPSSSSRVSRMDMNGVETQTNPIDRSIAHLLFHKMQPQPNPGQVAPSIDGSRVDPPNASLAGQANGHTVWNQGGVPQGNWAAQIPQLNLVEEMQPGNVPSADMSSAPSLPAPKVSIVPVPVSRLQDGSGLRVINPTEQQSGISSEAVRESPLGGHLQGNVAGAGSMNGELPSSIGSHLRNGTDGEKQVRPAQNSISASHKESGKMRNGLQRKRLQHAIGLKELSQVLAEDLDARSALSCNKESGLVQSGPPVSTSSGSNECQAGGFSKLTNGLEDEKTPMDESC